MSSLVSGASTPTVTPPSSPELGYCPPAILLRSAEVRAAFLSMHDEENFPDGDGSEGELATSASLPPMELPLNVYTGAPSDAECGLRPLLDIALENIDEQSKPIVSWLRNAPAVTVTEGQTRRTMARALAHYLNVLRSEGRARAVLLISRTDRTAKAWQDAILPLLDDTLDINIHQFFMAKGKRKQAATALGSLKFPGLFFASEKGMRCPETEPGTALLSHATAQNPHGVRWELVVSDFMRPNDVNDDVSPLRMLANHQTAQALIVRCTDDVKVRDPVLKRKHVAEFLRMHLARFDAKHKDIATVWCTPESLATAPCTKASDDKRQGSINEGSRKGKGSDCREIRERGKRLSVRPLEDRTLRAVQPKSDRKDEDDATSDKPDRGPDVGEQRETVPVGKGREMEFQMRNLRISTAAGSGQPPRVVESSGANSTTLQKPKRCRKTTKPATPSTILKPDGVLGIGIPASTSTSVSKRNRRFISEDILNFPPKGCQSSVAHAPKGPRCPLSTHDRGDHTFTVARDSDGSQEFFDARPWMASQSRNKRVDDNGLLAEQAGKRNFESEGALLVRDRLPSPPLSKARGPARAQPKIFASCRPEREGRKGRRLSREAKEPLVDLEMDPLLSVNQEMNSVSRNKQPSGAKISSRSASITNSRIHVRLKGKQDSSTRRPSELRDVRDGSEKAYNAEAPSVHNPTVAVDYNEKRRKKMRRSSSRADTSPVDEPVSGGRNRMSSRRRRSSGKNLVNWGKSGTRTRSSWELQTPKLPACATDVEVIEINSHDSEDGTVHVQNDKEVVEISSDEGSPEAKATKPRSRSSVPSKDGPTTIAADCARRKKSSGAPAIHLDVPVLTNVKKIRQDISALPAVEVRKYNQLIAQARAKEGKGPEGASEALQLYLEGLEIYDGDDFLTTRILALSTARNAWDDEKGSWAPRTSKSPIDKKRSRSRRRRSRNKLRHRRKSRAKDKSLGLEETSHGDDVIAISD